jgi:hypothetical protein
MKSFSWRVDRPTVLSPGGRPCFMQKPGEGLEAVTIIKLVKNPSGAYHGGL